MRPRHELGKPSFGTQLINTLIGGCNFHRFKNKTRLNAFFFHTGVMTEMWPNRTFPSCLTWSWIRFYGDFTPKDGELYSHSSLLVLRNAIERFLKNPPKNIIEAKKIKKVV